MVHIRYSRWAASGGDSLDPESVFDQLNENMNDTGDLQQAMRRLMQKGLKQGEKQTKGIEDLLSQVAREMRKLYDEYKLQSAMDEVQEKLDSVVDQEQQTLEQMDQSGQDVQENKQFLNDLPGKTSEAIDKLTSYRFENSNAEKDFEQLVMQLEQIRKLENWLRREGSLFRGQTPMDFQQSQELMERMEDLRKLESQLSSMQLKDVDKELLEKLLGGDPKQDFEGIMRMQSLLEEGGYVLESGDRFELTPKGVRRIGQLALRDIYQQLRRDGMGRHSTRNRGSQEDVPRKQQALCAGRSAAYQHDPDLEERAAARRRRAGADRAQGLFGLRNRAQYPRRHRAVVGHELVDELGRAASPRRKKSPWRWRVWCARCTRAITSASSVSLPAPSSSKPRTCRRRPGTWAIRSPTCRTACIWRTTMLDRKPSANQQIIVITDGQPTAYCRQGRLYCEWPLSFGGISQRAAEETLKEAERITRKGITINTFMLDDSPVLRGFVDDLTRINKGRAFYSRPDRLGEYLLVDYLTHQRKRV